MCKQRQLARFFANTHTRTHTHNLHIFTCEQGRLARYTV